MQRDFQHFVHQKKRKRRFLAIFIITLLFAVIAVFMQECSQSFDGPYNKDYQPMDQIKLNDRGN